MKWIKFKIKTITDAEDIIISTLYDIGLEGAQIEDKIPLTFSKTKVTEKKVSLNLSLATDAKTKLVEYANEKHISASALVSYWISEYCK